MYNISREISNLTTLQLSASINRALPPSFSNINGNNELRAASGNAMSVLALKSLPDAAGAYAIAPFLVPVALGSKLLESTALIEILALNSAILLFQSSIGSVLIE